MSVTILCIRVNCKVQTCNMCNGSGKIKEIVEHRGSWIYKDRRCDECQGFGMVDK